MNLVVLENIWGEKVEIGYRGGSFSKELVAITLIAVLVIVEIPIILLLLKKFDKADFNFILFLIAFLVLLLGVFILIFISSPVKLINIKVSKASGKIELEWKKNLIFKAHQTITNQLVKNISVSVFRTESKNRVRMEIEKLNGEKTIATFSYESSDHSENFDRALLNLAKIADFETYTAKRFFSFYEVLFTKASKGRVLIDKSHRELKFEDSQNEQRIREIKIPNLTVKELSEAKISLYKKPNFYDILRLLSIFIIFPTLFFFAYFSKDTKSYIPVVVTLFIYIFLIYIIRRFISPIETTIDKLRGIVKIRKLFFSYSFPLTQLQEIELLDQVSRRTGTFIFHVDGRLKNSRAHQLFYTEFSDKDEKRYEVFKNIMFLLEIIQAQLNIKIKDKTKNI